MNSADSRHWVRTFFPIWVGQALSLLGSQVTQFALIWWLTSSTGSATVLATASLVGLLPGVLIGPLAGALIDRLDRRLIMMLADGLSALAALALALLFWNDSAQLWHIYLILLLRALSGTFHLPAMQASTSLMVPHEQLARISGLNQMLQGAMNIAAPLLGALLLGLLPLYQVLLLDVVTAALAILPLFFVHIPRPPRAATSTAGPSLLADLREGLEYVWGWRGLRIVLFISVTLNFLLGPALALLPLLVVDHFGGGALELSWMTAAQWVGMLIGGVLLGAWGGLRSRIVTALLALAIAGLFLAAIGIAPTTMFWPALGALLISALFNSITNGAFMALLQTVVAPAIQGRVFTVTMSASMAMMPLGLLIAGPLADRFGVQLWFLVGGLACTLMGLAALTLPDVRRLEAGRDAEMVPDGATPSLS